MKRPRVTIRCPADLHHAPGERIIEITWPDGSGCLLTLTGGAVDGGGGSPNLYVYRADHEVELAPMQRRSRVGL